MSGHVYCDICGQNQEITDEWLTCVFCGEILRAHPYFGKPNGKVVNEIQGRIGNVIVRGTGPDVSDERHRSCEVGVGDGFQVRLVEREGPGSEEGLR